MLIVMTSRFEVKYCDANDSNEFDSLDSYIYDVTALWITYNRDMGHIKWSNVIYGRSLSETVLI